MKKLPVIASICLAVAFCVSCAAVGYVKPEFSGVIDEPAPPLGEAPVIVSADPEAEAVTLEISVSDDGLITYTYVNNTHETIRVLAIPRLERMIDSQWLHVAMQDEIGLCGTPDHIAANSRSIEWTLETDYLYGSALEPGTYRLSFDTVDEDYDKNGVITAEFVVKDAIAAE